MKAEKIVKELDTFNGETEVIATDGKGRYYNITDVLPYQQHGFVLVYIELRQVSPTASKKSRK